MDNLKVKNGKTYVLVFCKSIRKNGKTIYPKRSKVFKFWVPVEKSA